MRSGIKLITAIIITAFMLAACGKAQDNKDVTADTQTNISEEATVDTAEALSKEDENADINISEKNEDNKAEESEEPQEEKDEESSEEEDENEYESDEEVTPDENGTVVIQSSTSGDGKLVVIDPGHQRYGNSEQEPIGPGSGQTKAKVTGGTSGRTTGLAEYELTLMVAEKLKSVLEARGYTVMMTRTSHDVNISNSERAAVANNNGAGAFIRIHANGSDDTSVNGAMTICQTPSNPWNGNLYSKSRALSDAVLNGVVNATGCTKQYVWETDSMSGINWCTVPVTIIEMGYMTNPYEDTMMATEDYQWQLANGMADGIDAYFAQ